MDDYNDYPWKIVIFHSFLYVYQVYQRVVPQKICQDHGRTSATTPCHDTTSIACRLAGEVDSAQHAAPLAALDLVAGILRFHREARRRVRLPSGELT